MSFPNVIYGNYGDEKQVFTAAMPTTAEKANGYLEKGDKRLGTKLILPDGREFRLGKASATAIVQGKLYQQAAVSAADTMMTASHIVAATTAVGATSITITTSGTTAIAAGAFDDGYIYTASSVGTGIGWTYKIKSAASAAAGSASCVVSLAAGEKVQVATEGGTTKVGMRQNEFYNVLLTINNI